jgi:predicted branched-subunit amino acid permease
LWAFWQLTNIAGYFVGNLIPSAWSLDFAVPLCFIALVAPHFRTSPTIVAALVAGAGVLAFAALPMKLSLIVAGVAGIVAGTIADFAQERWTAR